METEFHKKIEKYYKELTNNNLVEEHKKDYNKFFEITKSNEGEIKEILYNEEEIKKAKGCFGYFCLVTNQEMEAFTALHLYRMKDVVEKGFGNLKERLNMRRLLVSSDRSLDGKLFVAFVALILLSHLNQKMKKEKLFKTFTMSQLLDTLDLIECYEADDSTFQVGELLTKQVEIYITLGVSPPSSL